MLSNSKKTRRKTIDRVIKLHEEMADKKMRELLSCNNQKRLGEIKPGSLTVEMLRQWYSEEQIKLNENRELYVNKLLDLYEIILALTDDEFFLSAGVRAECLEYLLEEWNEIIMDLVGIVQMEE